MEPGDEAIICIISDLDLHDHFSRLQVAKQEAEEMFHDVPLANGRKKNSRVYNLKANSIKSSQRSIVRNRQTRADRAKREALESFGGASMDTVQVKNNS